MSGLLIRWKATLATSTECSMTDLGSTRSLLELEEASGLAGLEKLEGSPQEIAVGLGDNVEADTLGAGQGALSIV